MGQHLRLLLASDNFIKILLYIKDILVNTFFVIGSLRLPKEYLLWALKHNSNMFPLEEFLIVSEFFLYQRYFGTFFLRRVLICVIMRINQCPKKS